MLKSESLSVCRVLPRLVAFMWSESHSVCWAGFIEMLVAFMFKVFTECWIDWNVCTICVCEKVIVLLFSARKGLLKFNYQRMCHSVANHWICWFRTTLLILFELRISQTHPKKLTSIWDQKLFICSSHPINILRFSDLYFTIFGLQLPFIDLNLTKRTQHFTWGFMIDW